MRFLGFVLLLILLDGCSCNKDVCYPRLGQENLTESWCYSADRNAAQACGYTREQCLEISQARRGGLCTGIMHHHVNDLSILPASSTAGAAGCAASAACGASACAVVYCAASASLPRSTARPL